MISQISSVSFLVYTLLCVGSLNTDSCGMWSQNWGSVRGCKNITVLNANVNSPEAAKFQNSIFLPLEMPPPAYNGRMPTFAPFPPPLTRRVYWPAKGQFARFQRINKLHTYIALYYIGAN